MKIQMVDLKTQYLKIKDEIDKAIDEVLENTAFINGKKVWEFAGNLEKYLGVKKAIPCGNGTDALQIALMALDLEPGTEVIVPAFTYIATVEVIKLLRLIPVLVDVDYRTFNIDVNTIEKAISPKTRVIMPVHLFGQSADMHKILEIAKKHNLYVIEDNAQAIGAEYTFPDGTVKKTGTIGTIGCTSFFPSKNLGAYGDGGAIFTNDENLGEKIKMIANHGQNKKYYHKYVGVNSRLDTIQAAILDVKLKYLDNYTKARQKADRKYNELLSDVKQILLPVTAPFTTHVFHQYTIIVEEGDRDELKAFLNQNGIPANIYYPLPIHRQEAYKDAVIRTELTNAEKLASKVLSLPMHTELTDEQQIFIASKIKEFFNRI